MVLLIYRPFIKLKLDILNLEVAATSFHISSRTRCELFSRRTRLEGAGIDIYAQPENDVLRENSRIPKGCC